MKTRIIGAIVALVIAVVGAFFLITYVSAPMPALRRVPSSPRCTSSTRPSRLALLARHVSDYIRVDTMPQRNLAGDNVSDLTELEGLVAASQILPGEQLLAARFADPAELAAEGEVPVPEGMQLVSFTLPADRVVGGQVRAGDRVGLVGTVDPDEPGDQEDVINPLSSSRSTASS